MALGTALEPLHVRFVRPGARVPARARPGDAGYDLCAAESFSLWPGERVTVPTGVAIALPPGVAGLVTPRSGLAAQHGISLVNGPGLIDPNYRGEIRVVLVNLGDAGFEAAAGDRIAQLLLVPFVTPDACVVDALPPAGDDRGENGFGSSACPLAEYIALTDVVGADDLVPHQGDPVADKTTSRARAGVLAGAAVAALLAFPGIASASGQLERRQRRAHRHERRRRRDRDHRSQRSGEGERRTDPGAAGERRQHHLDHGHRRRRRQRDRPVRRDAHDLPGHHGPQRHRQRRRRQRHDHRLRACRRDATAATATTRSPRTTTRRPRTPVVRDDARGDAGNDTIIWNGGDDDDLNEGGPALDTIQVNGATANETFTVNAATVA